MKRLAAFLAGSLALVLAPLMLEGCVPKPPPAAAIHYVREPAWQAGNVWFYPEQSFDDDRTGIAGVYSGPHAPLTTDGEAFDQNAMAAASQTLQLPAIVQVTALRTGRQIVVRVNDRGPEDPGRVIALTSRAASLLGMPPGGAEAVRVQVLGPPSRALADALHGNENGIAMQAAPRGAVAEQSLAPPPGARGSSGGPAIAVGQASGADGFGQDGPVPPLRLPERVTQVPPSPVTFWLQGDEFGRRDYAMRQQAQLAGLAPAIETVGNGRSLRYRLRAGPFPTIAAADAALAQAIRSGVTDARIVVGSDDGSFVE